MTAPTTFAAAQAVLAKRLPGYESRPQQVALAERVEAVFDNPNNFDQTGVREHLIGQAGTGCGKSLAYLIPAILWSAKTNKRVIVSVTTKALQNQLAGKDLPFLQENLGVKFEWTLLKGRSNYLCRNIASAVDAGDDTPHLSQVNARAAEEDFSGERDDLGFILTDLEWSKYRSDSEVCSDLGCNKNEDPDLTCYAAKARARAKGCQVVIVNHALFCTDLFHASNGLLEHYDAVIFDEAHELEDIAGNTLGGQLTEGSFRTLMSQINAWYARYGEDSEAVDAWTSEVISNAIRLFDKLVPGRFKATHLDAAVAEFDALSASLVSLREIFGKADVADEQNRKARVRKMILMRRLNSLTDRFHGVITESFTETVRWVEIERPPRGGERKVLKTAPVSVAPAMREYLYSKTPTIHVSATLKVKRGFDYIASRLGIDRYDALDVGTPFDYPTQARLYVPRHLPTPKGAAIPAWEDASADEIVKLVRASKGRALVLFTSNAHLRKTVAKIGAQIRKDYTLLVQGDATVGALTKQFAEDTSSVLFGTKSFFTGIDVQGEALSLVIVAKMPFPVPDEPLFQARCEAVEAAGGNAFMDYTIPVMSLVLQQAFGRLIRHTTDTGVAVVLDPRLVKSRYGKTIVEDLPPATRVDDLAAVEEFLAVAS